MQQLLSVYRVAARPQVYAAALLCLLIVACGSEPGDPESEIRAWIAAGVEAAEEEAKRDLMSMISPDYADARGNGRDDIENILRVYFLRADNVRLVTRIDDIRIIGEDAAEVDLSVAGAGTTSSRLGFSADAYNFSLELVRDQEWRLVSARWAEIGEQLH